MFSLELPHRGDSNDYTQHTIINIKSESPEISQIQCLQLWFVFCYGLKNEFETAVINEPSVFEPLKFYDIFVLNALRMKQKIELQFYSIPFYSIL